MRRVEAKAPLKPWLSKEKRNVSIGEISHYYRDFAEENFSLDKFIYLWIALVTAAQYSRASGNTDRKRVVNFFRGRRTLIFQVIKEHRKRMVKLAQRRGTEYGETIVDTGNPKLRAKLSKIVDFYNQGIRLDEGVFVEYVGELLNKIRNNLFHGGKVYDDREDIALISLVNPILQDVLKHCLFY